VALRRRARRSGPPPWRAPASRLRPTVVAGVVYVGGHERQALTPSTRQASQAAAALQRPAHRCGLPQPAAGSRPRPRSPTAWSTSAPTMTSFTPSMRRESRAAAALPRPARRSGREPPAAGSKSSPAVANGVVYVGSYEDDKLYAFAVGLQPRRRDLRTAVDCHNRRLDRGLARGRQRRGLHRFRQRSSIRVRRRRVDTLQAAAPRPALRSGRAQPAAISAPRPRSRTAWSTSAPSMTICMRSPSAAAAVAVRARRSGRAPPAATFRVPRPRSRTASSTWAPGMTSCTPSASPATGRSSTTR